MVGNEAQPRSARLATISALMVVSSFLAGKAARDAILLSRFSIESLPLFIGISAALSLPVIIVAGRLMVRYGPHRLVPAINVVSGAIAIVEWSLIDVYPRPIAIVVFIHLSTVSGVLVSGFWSIVNERFDVHTAKRHIGGIGMGATLGGILGGVIAERTAVYLPPDMILVVLAGMQLICAAMLYAFGRGVRVTEQPAPHDGTWSMLGASVRSPLLRKVGFIVVLTAISAGAMDYVFKADIVGGGSRDSLLRSLALFYTATNVVTAIIQVALCGPILTMLGVPRTVATLPYAITGFGILTLLAPVPLTAGVARAAELVTRNSVYRAGYELLFAPLPNEQKRPTKVALDVGADKIGDIIAAQLVGAIVYLVADARTGLLVTTVATGAIGVFVALRLPASYTRALEESLLTAVAELPHDDTSEPWISLTRMPSFGHPGDVVPLQLRNRRPQPRAENDTPRLLQLVRDLRSNNFKQIQRALADPLPAEVAPLVIELVGARDEIAREAILALRAAAPRCTGVLVETMLDQSRPIALRRRLPRLVARGEPALAAWGLWRGLADPSFELRYYCSAGLTPLAVHLHNVGQDDVFECVRRELDVDPVEWRARQLARDVLLDGDDEVADDIGLAHICRVLGLVLPAEPLRVALRAVQTDDPSLRGMALEYLESILPADVRAQLWPLLGDLGDVPVVIDRDDTGTDFLARVRLSYPTVLDKLKDGETG